ncbi:MAG: excinuclease ABC subunit B, partial [Candidatus Portnoybacteria bacterium CG10_big_fil_rev_8_21_14_0_10_44_7]
MLKFDLKTKYRPAGDQPQAIAKLVAGLRRKLKYQTLLGVTGSGKTFTMASVIAKIQRPTLIISHNKTLAAQLYEEFKEFFPKNEVHYFVSYYDYYQPEAYIPQTDTYIEKDVKINAEIDRLRHAATQALLARPDTLVVASVSCIYNIGSPTEYQAQSLTIKRGQKINRQMLLRQLIGLQYQRNDLALAAGTFRVLGEMIEIWPPTGQNIIRLEIWGDKIAQILISGEIKNGLGKSNTWEKYVPRFKRVSAVSVYPAKFWVAEQKKIKPAINNIKRELKQQLDKLKKQEKLLEAERLRRRTLFDLEMLAEVGYCSGMENYSGHLEARAPGSPPFTLIDYLPKGGLLMVDESHMTIPQIRGMHSGDQARKNVLVEHGFRLPSALDNRPLKFTEFERKIGQTIFVSATPGDFEKKKSRLIARQIIRPTGLLDPSVEIRSTANQIPDLMAEIKKRTAKKQRVLVTTLTKRLAEDLADYLAQRKIKAHFLHSEIKTLERPGILLNLRRGKFDAVVGINLLREGLDLPEVSLVAILDA